MQSERIVFEIGLYLIFQEMAKQSPECEPEVMDSNDFLFLLYTSGSTGNPKGIVHAQAGYLLYALCTQKVDYFVTCMYKLC